MKSALVAVLIFTSFSAFSKDCKKAFGHIVYAAEQLGSSEGIIQSGIKAGIIKTSEAAEVISENQILDSELESTAAELSDSCLPTDCQAEFKTLVSNSRLHGFKEGELIIAKKIGNTKNVSKKLEAYSNETLTLKQNNENFIGSCLQEMSIFSKLFKK